MQRRLLFVDDESTIRATLPVILRLHNFDVSVAESVSEALRKITTEKFDVLLSDLNIGNPGDGLTVVSAMRRTQPEAVTMILTGYPAFETALEAIRQQVDDYIVKPANIPNLVHSIESKLALPTRARQLPPPKRVAMILQENFERVEELWLHAIHENPALSRLPVSTEQRREALQVILAEVVRAAQSYTGEAPIQPVPTAHFSRKLDGYSATTLLAEFCALRSVIAQIVQENLLAVNLSFVVPDLAKVNESIDQQAQATVAALPERMGNDKALTQ